MPSGAGSAPEVDTPIHEIEEGHKAVFGCESYRVGSGDLPGWLELPDEALSYHVAHELTYLVMRRQGFPNNVRGPQYSEDSPEARVGGDLEEMISHPCLEEMLRPFPFDRTHIQQHLFEGPAEAWRVALCRNSAPTGGSHGHADSASYSFCCHINSGYGWKLSTMTVVRVFQRRAGSWWTSCSRKASRPLTRHCRPCQRQGTPWG